MLRLHHLCFAAAKSLQVVSGCAHTAKYYLQHSAAVSQIHRVNR